MKNSHLKFMRMKSMMSQVELSKRSGVSRQTIVEIENGTRINVTTSTIEKLAAALGCSIEELF